MTKLIYARVRRFKKKVRLNTRIKIVMNKEQK